MENYSDPLQGPSQDSAVSAAETLSIPPKPSPEEPKSVASIRLRSATSLALYLLLGYYIFHSFEWLLLITAIVVFHELGHFFAMKAFRYKDLGIFFIPLLGAYVSGSKREVSQRESAIILLAGPLPGIIVGAVLFLIHKSDSSYGIGNISLETVSVLLIFLNI